MLMELLTCLCRVEGQRKTKLLKRQRYFIGNLKVNLFRCELRNSIWSGPYGSTMSTCCTVYFH